MGSFARSSKDLEINTQRLETKDLLGIALALWIGGGQEGSMTSSPALDARANQAGASWNPSIPRCLLGTYILWCAYS